MNSIEKARNAINKRLDEQGKTITALAMDTGLSYATVSEFRKNKTAPNALTLSRMAKAAGMTQSEVEEIFKDDDCD